MAMAPALRQTQHLAVAGGNPRGGPNGGGGGCGRGGLGQGRANGRPGSSGERPICQLCGNEGHTVIKCYKRFDHSFTGASEQKMQHCHCDFFVFLLSSVTSVKN
jgi:hypothetical protein